MSLMLYMLFADRNMVDKKYFVKLKQIAEMRLNGIKCACCGKLPDITETTHNLHNDPGNKNGSQYLGYLSDFHFHHLIYKNDLIVYYDINGRKQNECGVYLCRNCHMKQKPKTNNTPVNRFIQLYKTTNIEDTKNWCSEWLRILNKNKAGRDQTKKDFLLFGCSNINCNECPCDNFEYPEMLVYI